MSIFSNIKNFATESFTNTSDFIRGTGSTFIEVITDNNISNKISEIKEKGTQKRLTSQMSKLDKKSAKLQKETLKLLEAKAKLEAEKLFTNN